MRRKEASLSVVIASMIMLAASIIVTLSHPQQLLREKDCRYNYDTQTCFFFS
jgi:hypothetical protein